MVAFQVHGERKDMGMLKVLFKRRNKTSICMTDSPQIT